MEMTMNMITLAPMSFDEMMAVDGGVSGLDIGMAIAGVYSAAISVCGYLGTTSLACAGVCAAVAGAPVVAATTAICGVVAAAYGVYTLVK